MIYIAVTCLVLQLCILVALLVRITDLKDYARGTHKAVMDVKRQTFTRIGQASMQSGAVSEEQQLARLGRASSARRIVVGGDHDSELSKNLSDQAVTGRVRRGAVNRIRVGGEDDGSGSNSDD